MLFKKMKQIKYNYVLLPPKPVVVFEVFLPKKDEYEAKLREVLGAFVETDGLKKIPDIKKIINIRSKIESGFDEKHFLQNISEVISGYSIYEVDGRFKGLDKDERTWVIRFIIHDPKLEGAIRKALILKSKEIICYLITKRFAEEIGIEDEIWFVEYQNCLLQRWVNDSYED